MTMNAKQMAEALGALLYLVQKPEFVREQLAELGAASELAEKGQAACERERNALAAEMKAFGIQQAEFVTAKAKATGALEKREEAVAARERALAFKGTAFESAEDEPEPKPAKHHRGRGK